MAPIPFTHRGPEDGGNYEHQWSNDTLDGYFISDVGKKREHNEDGCIMCAPDDGQLANDRGIMFAVADGMGGASAGELASQMTLETFTEELFTGDLTDLPRHMEKAVKAANGAVFSKAENDPELYGMGTTLSAMTVVDDRAYIAHVGDSRIYLLRNRSKMLQLTDDHSLVAEQVRGGYISEAEARTHNLKNLITRAVGIKAEVEVDLRCVKLKKGDTLLLCSDGLCGMIEDPDIESALHLDTLQAAARVLVGRALEQGGSDNVTAVLMRIKKPLPSGPHRGDCEEYTIPSDGFFDKVVRFFLGD